MPYRPIRRTVESTERMALWRSSIASGQDATSVNVESLCDLENELFGHIVLPSSASYEADRQESNPAFQAYPQMIVYCEVVNDVRLSLQFAQANNLWVACRSGGHSTAGYSVNSGLVIDVSKLNSVCVDPVNCLARVGAGTNFGRLNAHLNDYGLHVPGGACEEVCVAGYMQGGGFGYTSRQFGMNCDNVESFRMMLRNGRVVTANTTTNADLFWAVRGGTGGNFGVLLEITYRLHRLDPVWGFARVWDMEKAPQLLQELQRNYMRSGASPRLGYMGNLATHENQHVFVLQGLYNGTAEEGRESLAALSDIAAPLQTLETVLPYAKMDNWLDNNPYPIPNVAHGSREDKQAGYIDRSLEVDDWKRIVEYYKTSPRAANTAVIEPYGGAISNAPVGDNAFIHRDVDMDFFVDVFWLKDDERQAAVDWLDTYMALLNNYFNGHVYQNYPRRDLTDYRSMYFGKAFDRLLTVKNKYDPAPYFFDYEQSIKPYDYVPSPENGEDNGGTSGAFEVLDLEIDYS